MIYLVRHGQTDWNVMGKNQGWSDIEMNETGIEQAKLLAKQIKGIEFDIVFSSPLKRALKTAEIIHNGDIIIDERIIERSNGELEGQSYVDSLAILSDPNETRYGIEPIPDFRKRINDFWDDITAKHLGKNILVVTHEGVILYSQTYFKGEPKDGDYLSYKLENGDVLQIENNHLKN